MIPPEDATRGRAVRILIVIGEERKAEKAGWAFQVLLNPVIKYVFIRSKYSLISSVVRCSFYFYV
jgi:hypothetical protein